MHWVKKSCALLAISLFLSFLGIELVFAATGSAPSNSIGAIAENVQSSYSALSKLFTATSYLMGICFFVAGVYGLKTFKDNPTQHQIGKPLMMIAIGALLTFLPSFVGTGGATIFGSSALSTGTSGFNSVPS